MLVVTEPGLIVLKLFVREEMEVVCTWAETISGIHDAHVNKRPAKKVILLIFDEGM